MSVPIPGRYRWRCAAAGEAEVDLQAVNDDLVSVAKTITEARTKHNKFLKQLGPPALP